MRLINVNDADPRSMAFPIHADGGEYTPYERGYNDGVISCYGLLMNAPTIDATEVVRCNWIPVSERLPEEVLEDGEKPHTASALVLVAVMDDENRRFVADDITFDGEWVNFRFPEFEVTHWMPLPEPPKEGHHET